MYLKPLAMLTSMISLFLVLEAAVGNPEYIVRDSFPVAPVFSATYVGFTLLTENGRQYVAYYDTLRRMTIAARRLEDMEWQYKILPSTWEWDNHNYVILALDDSGYIHVSGNMHVANLVYFRSTHPNDISEFTAPGMVGLLENSVTYPMFIKNNEGRLIFIYREGDSQNGRTIMNIYDASNKSWQRFIATPLFDGLGSANAYFSTSMNLLFSPTVFVSAEYYDYARYVDGYFHLCWMWRSLYDGSTNRDISYTRSLDMAHWETAGGVSIALPITPNTEGVVIDATPSGGGLSNMGGFGVGLDGSLRPVVSYTRYDGNGYSQIYNTRYENGQWVIHKSSDWAWSWDLSGGGAMSSDVGAGPVKILADGRLVQDYWNKAYGQGAWRLDEDSLVPMDSVFLPGYPASLLQIQSAFPEMAVRWSTDHGQSVDMSNFYRIRWETLSLNRDAPRNPPYPEPSQLMVYQFYNPFFDSGQEDNEPGIMRSENLVLSASPNPFNSNSHISYYLPQKEAVSLVLFNLQGKIVRELINGVVPMGRHSVHVEAGGLASGIYICELKSNVTSKRFKLVLMR